MSRSDDAVGVLEGPFLDELMQRLVEGSGRGVDLDVLAPWNRVLESLSAGDDVWRSTRFDAVLLLAPVPPRSGLARQQTLLDSAMRMLATRSPVRLAHSDAGPHDRAGRYADGPLPPADSARRVAELLLDAAGSSRRGQPVVQDERLRQEAVDRLGDLVSLVDRRLHGVVQMTQRTFDLPTAAINVLDGDRLVAVASIGAPTGTRPRATALCNRTIQRPGLDLLPDTWADPSLAGNPMIQGPTGVRFYAAYPIESVDGYRLGALCVYDTEPHDPDEFDFTMLRDLALLAEGELATLAQRT